MVTRLSTHHIPTQKRAGYLSLAVALFLLGVKSTAYFITHSAAILSDALESLLHILPTLVVVFSLHYTAKPADKNHLYGHGKIEYLSTAIEATAIFIAAITIIVKAIERIVHESPLYHLSEGFWLLVAAMVINTLLGSYLIRQGKKTNSLVLESNGRHILTDVWTSFGVAIGLILVIITKIALIDSILAIMVAIQIIITSFKLYRRSLSGIMDESLTKDDELIRNILENHLHKHICEYHRLRHRRSGNTIHIDFHIHLPAFYHLDHAHHIATELEREIASHYDNVVVISHIEPCERENCPTCILLKNSNK